MSGVTKRLLREGYGETDGGGRGAGLAPGRGGGSGREPPGRRFGGGRFRGRRSTRGICSGFWVRPSRPPSPPTPVRAPPPCPRAPRPHSARARPLSVRAPPPSSRPARCPAGPSVRWAGRRADVARDAGRFLRRRCCRLCLACQPGFYENTRRRAARDPRCVRRAAAGPACAEPGGAALPAPCRLPLRSPR